MSENSADVALLRSVPDRPIESQLHTKPVSHGWRQAAPAIGRPHGRSARRTSGAYALSNR